MLNARVPGAPARNLGPGEWEIQNQLGTELEMGSVDGAEVWVHSSTPSSQEPILPEHEELAFSKENPAKFVEKVAIC